MCNVLGIYAFSEVELIKKYRGAHQLVGSLSWSIEFVLRYAYAVMLRTSGVELCFFFVN